MRPVQYWVLFGACVAILLGAMGWVTVTAVRVDKAQMEVRRRSLFEESVRVALWRMESAVAPILAREGARPYFVYSAFYPAERAYNKMYEDEGEMEILDMEVMVPSPLLTEKAKYVLVHFQMDPEGKITSPRLPEARWRESAIKAYDNGAVMAAADEIMKSMTNSLDRESLLAALPVNRTERRETPNLAQQVRQPELQQMYVGNSSLLAQQGEQAYSQQQQVTINEWNVRNYQKERLQASANPRAQGKIRIVKGGAKPAVTEVIEGPMQSLWVNDMLLLVRRVTINGQDYVQGCRLSWPDVRRTLLDGIRDILPNASLRAWRQEASDSRENSRRLAGIPVVLEAGEPPRPPSGGMTPVAFSLVVAWCCVLAAATAVGGLLMGAVTLSERRGAFVSAVTHELRTPLTTFRMYAEMLAEGMVPDESKRKKYLSTLCAEGNRLAHLVENVLAYARLERGRARRQVETVAVREVMSRVTARLTQRAEQAGMALEISEANADGSLRADVSVVEQILFNLVDNACKYAAKAEDRRIHLEVGVDGRNVVLRVRDHGDGISESDRRMLFKPFTKSAKHAAESAPGVGLGLALSRRLARELGGDLRLCRGDGSGACFELFLPSVRAL